MGYTLPVFACASAVAALRCIQEEKIDTLVTIDLIEPAEKASIPIEQVANLTDKSALAISLSDPGDHLDITRNTPVWALVTIERSQNERTQINIQGGSGIGVQTFNNDRPAIYSYAKKLIIHNLQPLLEESVTVTVKIILPEGRKLSLRTSNAAFGIVEGLSLLGTTGIVKPLTAPGQLAAYQAELIAKAKKYDSLVFCIGENGLDLATKWNVNPERIVKTANWLGSMLVTAATYRVRSIVLLGYHGKLIKLAGGIWHTHHHLADGRLEILTAFAARYGLATPEIEQIAESPTTESALQLLRRWDEANNRNNAEVIYSAIADTIDSRSQAYIKKHTTQNVLVGSILFDGNRKIIQKSQYAEKEFVNLC